MRDLYHRGPCDKSSINILPLFIWFKQHFIKNADGAVKTPKFLHGLLTRTPFGLFGMRPMQDGLIPIIDYNPNQAVGVRSELEVFIRPPSSNPHEPTTGKPSTVPSKKIWRVKQEQCNPSINKLSSFPHSLALDFVKASVNGQQERANELWTQLLSIFPTTSWLLASVLWVLYSLDTARSGIWDVLSYSTYVIHETIKIFGCFAMVPFQELLDEFVPRSLAVASRHSSWYYSMLKIESPCNIRFVLDQWMLDAQSTAKYLPISEYALSEFRVLAVRHGDLDLVKRLTEPPFSPLGKVLGKKEVRWLLIPVHNVYRQYTPGDVQPTIAEGHVECLRYLWKRNMLPKCHVGMISGIHIYGNERLFRFMTRETDLLQDILRKVEAKGFLCMQELRPFYFTPLTDGMRTTMLTKKEMGAINGRYLEVMQPFLERDPPLYKRVFEANLKDAFTTGRLWLIQYWFNQCSNHVYSFALNGRHTLAPRSTRQDASSMQYNMFALQRKVQGMLHELLPLSSCWIDGIIAAEKWAIAMHRLQAYQRDARSLGATCPQDGGHLEWDPIKQYRKEMTGLFQWMKNIGWVRHPQEDANGIPHSITTAIRMGSAWLAEKVVEHFLPNYNFFLNPSTELEEFCRAHLHTIQGWKWAIRRGIVAHTGTNTWVISSADKHWLSTVTAECREWLLSMSDTSDKAGDYKDSERPNIRFIFPQNSVMDVQMLRIIASDRGRSLFYNTAYHDCGLQFLLWIVQDGLGLATSESERTLLLCILDWLYSQVPFKNDFIAQIEASQMICDITQPAQVRKDVMRWLFAHPPIFEVANAEEKESFQAQYMQKIKRLSESDREKDVYQKFCEHVCFLRDEMNRKDMPALLCIPSK
jgi:hypothetical protein